MARSLIAPTELREAPFAACTVNARANAAAKRNEIFVWIM